MIEDAQQYQVTLDQLKKFEEALEQVRGLPDDDERLHPLMRQAYQDAFEGTIQELRAELAEYEARQQTFLTKTP